MSKRAELRRQAKTEADKAKTYTMTFDQIAEMVSKEAAIVAHDELAKATQFACVRYMKIWDAALYMALADMGWAMSSRAKKWKRLGDLIDGYVGTINRLLGEGNEKAIRELCGRMGLDSEDIFGYDKKIREAYPDKDENGELLIYLGE